MHVIHLYLASRPYTLHVALFRIREVLLHPQDFSWTMLQGVLRSSAAISLSISQLHTGWLRISSYMTRSTGDQQCRANVTSRP